MNEFVNTDKYGKLYIDRILFESGFPIIFTCKNDFNEIFICVCCQNNDKGCKWLVGKTDGMSMIRMLKDEITIRETICKCSSGRISVDYVNGEYKIEYNNSDWNENSIYLHKDDSYMFAEEGEFDDDIAYFSTLIQVCYDISYYKNVSKTVETINKESELVPDVFNELMIMSGNINVSGNIVNTFEVTGKIHISSSTDTKNYMNPVKYKLIFDNSFNTSINDNISIKLAAADDSLADAA